MNNGMRAVLLALLVLACATVGSEARCDSALNVILCIGDGMGAGQIEAGSMYLTGSIAGLPFESLPFQGQVTTYSASYPAVTDSAASATAIATGHKVYNGVLSLAHPGDGSPLKTILEMARDEGKMTGLVTNDALTGATPAAFGSHELDRYNYSGVANDYLTESKPNLLFGGGQQGMPGNAAVQSAGYTVVSDRAQMLALDPSTTHYVCGEFGDGSMPYEYDYSHGLTNAYDTLPHLTEMTDSALSILSHSSNGFLLMMEDNNIDYACHANDIDREVAQEVEFSHSVDLALAFAATHPDTLVLITADHETGGLQVLTNNGIGAAPTVSWTTTNHTAANVPVFATGPGAQAVTGTLDNTDLFHIMAGEENTAATPEPPSAVLVAAALLCLAIVRVRRQSATAPHLL